MVTSRLKALDAYSGVPSYLQIVQQVKQSLQVGALQVGDQLPTIKEVVAHVAVNPNTVAKAYRELERIGLVEGRAGTGTFVKGRPAGPSPKIQERLNKDLKSWVAKARKAGLDNGSIEALVHVALHT